MGTPNSFRRGNIPVFSKPDGDYLPILSVTVELAGETLPSHTCHVRRPLARTVSEFKTQ